jgi:hypothetical protein
MHQMNQIVTKETALSMGFPLPYLKNLLSKEVEYTDAPWLLPRTEYTVTTKRGKADQSSNPQMERAYLGSAIGLNKNARVSDQNPPNQIVAFIADYDNMMFATVDDLVDMFAKIAKSKKEFIPPTWVYESSGGNGCHCIWELEESIPVTGKEHGAQILRQLAIRTKAAKIFSGSMDLASYNPTQYFDSSLDWRRVGEPLPAARCMQIFNEVYTKKQSAVRGTWPEAGVSFTWERLRQELRKDYPDAGIDWDTFAEGSRCRRFWAEGDNPTACMVTPVGMVCFTGDRGFLPWNQIVSGNWMAECAAENMRAAVQGIWLMNTTYVNIADDGSVGNWSSEMVKRFLKVYRKIDSTSEKGAPSQMEEVLAFVEQHRRITRKVPLLYTTEREVQLEGGDRVLNVSRYTVPPRTGLIVNREDMPRFTPEFLWLMKKTCGLILEPGNAIRQTQFDRFIGWQALFRQSMLDGDWFRGPALLAIGDPDTGKNMLVELVLARIFGCVPENAGRMLLSQDQFNMALMHSPIWYGQDLVLNRPEDTVRFSQMVKSVVANDYQTYRAMRQDPCQIRWGGRLFIGANMGSTGALPRIEDNVLDKVIGLKFDDAFTSERVPNAAALEAELPYIRALLEGWVVDEDLRDPRWGMKHWLHPELKGIAAEQSDAHVVMAAMVQFAQEREDNVIKSTRASLLLGKLQTSDSARRILDNKPGVAGRFSRIMRELDKPENAGWLRYSKTSYKYYLNLGVLNERWEAE